MRDQFSKSENGEVVVKNETPVSSPPTKVKVSGAKESGADKLQRAVQEVWTAYLRMAESVWNLGEALIKCEQAYKEVHGELPTLRHLGELLGLPLSQQRIGQILNTTKAVPKQYQDNNLDFKRYQVAVQANNALARSSRFSTDKLMEVVTKYDAKDIPTVVKHAKNLEKPEVPTEKHREVAFSVSYAFDVTGKMTDKVKYFAQPSYELARRGSTSTSWYLPDGWDQDAEKWRKMTANASAAAIIQFIHLLAKYPIADPEMRQKRTTWMLRYWWHFIYTTLMAWHNQFQNDVIMAEAIKVLWPEPPADPGRQPTEADKMDLLDFSEEPAPAGEKPVASMSTPTPAQVVSKIGLGDVPSPKRTARRKRGGEANTEPVSDSRKGGAK